MFLYRTINRFLEVFMENSLEDLFRSDYMPHGHCYLWKPEILWLNVSSDLLIALSYFTIPLAIYYFVKNRPGLEFKGVFMLFSWFILLCGLTHLYSIYVIWNGAYGIHGLLKATTAIVSAMTAYVSFKSIPKALAIPSFAEFKLVSDENNQRKIEKIEFENMRQQEILLRESTESAHVGIFVVDQDSNIMVANDAATKIFGYQKEELESYKLETVLDVELQGRHRTFVKNFIDGEVPEKLMANNRLVYGLTKNGKRVPIEVRLNKRIYKNEPCVFASFLDITERLSVQQALEDSELTNRSIVESLPQGLHVYKLKQGELVLASYNEAACKILKTDHENLVNKRIEDAFPNVKDTDLPKIYKDIAKNGGTYSQEAMTYTDGNISGTFALQCIQSIRDTAIVLFEDITEKREAELALRAKDNFIKSAFDTAITGVYIYDIEEQQIDFLNQSFTHITGYSLPELQNLDLKGFAALFAPGDWQRMESHLRLLEVKSEPDSSEELEYRFKCKDGSIINCLSRVRGLEYTEQGKLKKFVGSFLDITQLSQMQDNLLEAKELAEKANLAKTEFLANMSHEIRTPMNAIIGLTDLILDMPLGDKQKDYLQKVQSSSKSLLKILNDILDYSKMEAGKLQIVVEPFSFESLLNETTDLFSLLCEEKQLELKVDVEPDMDLWFEGDSLRISQILNNLVGNAIKFTHQGYVKIKASQLNKDGDMFVKIAVEDTGIGMTQEQSDHLFESFTQADNSIIRKYGGSGLGLSICKSLANLMGGTIECTSKKNEGSTFSLQIPLTPVKLDVISEQLQLKPMKTLIVDDNVQTVEFLVNTLVSWDFSVDSCYSAERALELIEASVHNDPYDLLIVDWRMPEIDGVELINEINERATFKALEANLFIVLITAFGKEHAIKSGAMMLSDRIIEKPIRANTLKHELYHLQNNQSKSTTSAAANDFSNKPVYRGKTVLVVEDNLTNQIVAIEYLKRFGLSVLTATNGQEAVNILGNNHVDLVLMDLHMPIMDGYTATRQIRQTQGLEALPIYAMSAAVMQSDIERVKLAEMDGHIAKPVDMENLSKVINSALGTTSSVPLPKPQNHYAESPLQPKGFDVDKALKLCGNDITAYEKILVGFLTDYTDKASQIGEYIQNQQFEQLITIAHNLSAAAGSIGASELQKLAKEIDQDYQKSSIVEPNKAEQLAIRLEQAIASIAQVLPERALPQSPEQSVDTNKKIETLEALQKLLKGNKFISVDSLHQNMPNVSRTLNKEHYSLLITFLAKLDYSAAIKMIEDELTTLKNQSE